MSVISFDDWRKKKARASALTSRGALRADVSQREAYGFDLCVYISEESALSRPDASELDKLWSDLRALMEELPQEHGYFYFAAFTAFFHDDPEGFFKHFDRYLESEQRLYGDIAGCDWWIDSFFWVFTPPLPGMYGRCGELFDRHWPHCAMSSVCAALDQGSTNEPGGSDELQLLHLAIQTDPDCYLAHYLIASIYYEQQLWKSALPYFEKAAGSSMYREDAAFYFDYAWATEKAGKPDEAIARYQSCILLDEAYPSALNNLGCVYMRQQRLVDAERTFQQAIQLGLDDALPYRNMVTVLVLQARRDDAIAFIQKQADVLGQRYEIVLNYLQSSPDGQPPLHFSMEGNEPGGSNMHKRILEDWLEERIAQGQGCFGRELAVLEDEGGYGRSYFLPEAGILDLCCINRKDNEILAIWVNGGLADERDLLLLWQQVNILQKRRGSLYDKVTGILLAPQFAPALQQRSSLLVESGVELYKMHMDCIRAN